MALGFGLGIGLALILTYLLGWPTGVGVVFLTSGTVLLIAGFLNSHSSLPGDRLTKTARFLK